MITMAYTIEQTINGRKYLYRVEAYWDKEKKTIATETHPFRPKRFKI